MELLLDIDQFRSFLNESLNKDIAGLKMFIRNSINKGSERMHFCQFIFSYIISQQDLSDCHEEIGSFFKLEGHLYNSREEFSKVILHLVPHMIEFRRDNLCNTLLKAVFKGKA